MPALLETAVRPFMWGFAWTVFMRVSGTPQRPNPPARRVVLPFMFSMAAEAEGRILLICFRERVVEKDRAVKEDCGVWSALSKDHSGLEPHLGGA